MIIMCKRLDNNIKKMKKNISKEAKIEPFGDRVLVRPFTEEDLRQKDGLGKKSLSGIILPESVTKEKSAQGKVLAVGEGKLVDGKIVPLRVKVGNIIIFSKYGYDEIEHEGEELYLLKEENILGIIR